MAMQTDVKAAHLNASGILVVGRTRLRAIAGVASATAGTVNLWDSVTAPTAATYARSGTTITVTLASHGFSIGQTVGLVFSAASGVSATNGNYVIQSGSFTSGVFTVTDINSGTIAASTVCAVSGVGLWLTSYDTGATSTEVINTLIPGEGMLAQTGLYAQMTNQTGLTVFFG